MLLEHWLERRLGDVQRVVGDCECGAYRQRLQRLVRFEACGQKGLHRRVANVTTLLDQTARVSREGGVARLLRRATLADRLDVGGVQSRLEREIAVEGDRPGAAVSDRIGQEQCLDFCLGERPAVYALK